jgi:hypothetical protein
MGRRILGLAVLVAALTAAGVGAHPVKGDGLPVEGVSADRSGVTTPDHPLRYVAFSTARGTIVAGVARAGGQVLRSTFLRGDYAIPAVALDSSASGLSADGGTLTMLNPRRGFPRARTPLAILDTDPLRLRERVTLRGDFSFDAISPDGAWIYLVQYLSPTDPTRYQVRAYDVRGGRLAPDPIVDPSEPEERMGGFPITRAMSPNGRWAYTLYDGAGKDPFVHALDTVGRTAACVELRGLTYQDVSGVAPPTLDLGAGGGSLAVMGRGGPLALIDTESFRVTYPNPERAADEPGGGGLPWLLPAGAVAALLAALAFAVSRRRGRVSQPALPPDPLPALPDHGEPDGGEGLRAGLGDAANGSLHGDEIGAVADHAQQGVER